MQVLAKTISKIHISYRYLYSQTQSQYIHFLIDQVQDQENNDNRVVALSAITYINGILAVEGRQLETHTKS